MESANFKRRQQETPKIHMVQFISQMQLRNSIGLSTYMKNKLRNKGIITQNLKESYMKKVKVIIETLV